MFYSTQVLDSAEELLHQIYCQFPIKYLLCFRPTPVWLREAFSLDGNSKVQNVAVGIKQNNCNSSIAY